MLYETGRKLFTEAGYEEVGMDHFALRSDSLYKAQRNRNLHRNFMGYTHQYTQLMIGLGVSSISDTWDAFAQNVKTVEEYKKLVAENIIPVFKGHLLNSEDLLMRKHILNIMCKDGTSWTELDLLNEQFSLAINNLDEVTKDELIIKSDYSLQVTAKGKRFLRNICAAFDARLWKNQPEKQLFSLG